MPRSKEPFWGCNAKPFFLQAVVGLVAWYVSYSLFYDPVRLFILSLME